MTTQTAKRIVLVAGIGTSPAVLTETVWALAHQKEPVVPDVVEVITTKSGREVLQNAVTTGSPSVWERLKSALRRERLDLDGKLVFGETSIHAIPDNCGNAVSDLRTGDDNLLAADFMLGELRRYTESPDTVVLCSIAGGRKTMSALLFSCMTLLGRECDRVYHVLIPPEYECGMNPPFYFPEKGAAHRLVSRDGRNGAEIPSSKIAIELFEVPFVRMRGWYQDRFKTIPPSYRTLISKVQSAAPPAVAYPEIEIDAWNKGATINGFAVSLSNPCFAMLVLLAGGCPSNELYGRLLALHDIGGVAKCDWLSSFQESPRFETDACPEDLNKVQSELRRKLKEAGLVNPGTLVPQRGAPVMFPLSKIKWRNRVRLADICGNLFKPPVR